MPSPEYREREPEEVITKETQEGKLVTVGRDGSSYTGNKKGPKFKDEITSVLNEETPNDGLSVKERNALVWEKIRADKRKEELSKQEQRALKEKRTRQKRTFLIRAFVRYEGDIERMREDIKNNPIEWKKWQEDDEMMLWLERLSGNSKDIIEEHILMTRYEVAVKSNAQGNSAAKILLPAINKHRYNLQVQANETMSEGMAELLTNIAKRPMTHVQMLNILLPEDKRELIGLPDHLNIPTLEAAIEEKKNKPLQIEDTKHNLKDEEE
jgi:hypothetical protein